MWIIRAFILKLADSTQLITLQPGFTVAKQKFFKWFYTQKSRVFDAIFIKKLSFFYDFANTLLRFFPFITAIYSCCINMYHIFRKKEYYKHKKQFISYLVLNGKCTIGWYMELRNYVKLCTINFICFIEVNYNKYLPCFNNNGFWVKRS